MKYRDLEERLIANSVVDRDLGCWLWIGHRSADGYGQLSVRVSGKVVKKWAHRVAYEHLKGPIADGHDVDHMCRVNHCINPDHLRERLPSENRADNRRKRKNK
jgi:hypothetical protein